MYVHRDDLDSLPMTEVNTLSFKINVSFQAQAQPKVSWTVDDAVAYYTLMMVDPDALCGTPRANALRWIVVNVPGTEVDKNRH